MENKVLIDLSVTYGLDSTQLTKVADAAYQSGALDMNSREFKRIATFICTMNLVDKPMEEILEELKLKGIVSGK